MIVGVRVSSLSILHSRHFFISRLYGVSQQIQIAVAKPSSLFSSISRTIRKLLCILIALSAPSNRFSAEV